MNKSKEYDLVVIGGGINGAAVAWDAALRGLSVCLLEKGDFGSGSSSGCFRIAHGGLRYLQHLDLRRMFESVLEQRTLRIIAPHFVKPLEFMVPCSGSGSKSKSFLSLGLAVYQALTFWKNFGVAANNKLPLFKMLSKEGLGTELPKLAQQNCSGAVTFSDCQIFNCDRLTYSIVHSAKLAGAATLNYHKVVSFNKEADNKGTGALKSVKVKKVLTGEEIEISGKFFVNASGPWVEGVLELANSRKRPDVFSKGVQAVVSGQLSDKAIALESQHIDSSTLISRGGRSYFIVPWRGHTLVGTSDSVFKGDPDDFQVKQEEVEDLLSEVSSLLGEKVSLSGFGGLRPVDFTKLGANEGDATVSNQDIIEDYKEIDNLISLIGVKYTTFRAFAKKAVDRISSKSSITSKTKIYGGQFSNLTELEKELAEAKLFSGTTIKRLVSDYGSKARDIVSLAKADNSLREELGGITAAELAFVCREEQVEQLDDALKRRTPFLSFGKPSQEQLARAAELVAREKGWSGEELDSQINQLVSNA